MALGRGLDALLGDTTLQAQTGGSVNLPISQVEPGLNQPRKHFDEEALADLAESIRQHGMLQPLTVRRLASGYYQIIAGERRWRAARQAGLTLVDAGHYATEVCIVDALGGWLQEAFPALRVLVHRGEAPYRTIE